jgi:hypothetical protein
MIITPINSTESAVHLSGYVTGATSGYKEVWPISATTASIAIPEILRQVSVSSSDTTDVSTNAGAHSVLLEGLDKTFKSQSEYVDLNGRTGVISEKAYRAINSVKVVSSGVDGANKGLIYVGSGTISSGVPATSYCVIDQAISVSETLSFTVPIGHVLEIESISVVPKTMATTSLHWEILKAHVVNSIEVDQVVYTSMYRGTQFENVQKLHRPLTIEARRTVKMRVSQLNANGDVLVHIIGKLIKQYV